MVVNKYGVNYHCNPSGIAQGYILLYFYRLLWVIFFSRIFVAFSHKTVYPPIGENFQIYVVQITGKCNLELKKTESSDFFPSFPLQAKLSPWFLSSPLGNYSFSFSIIHLIFFQKSISPLAEWERKL